MLPHAEGTLQTVIVMIAARNDVEEYLGQLEGQGSLADRLDLPQLDQLQATTVTQNGAWIYPEAPGGRNAALVAWWYGGVLHNLDLITLPATKRPEALKEQLLQLAKAELKPPMLHQAHYSLGSTRASSPCRPSKNVTGTRERYRVPHTAQAYL